MDAWWIAVGIGCAVALGGLGAWVAAQKGRAPGEGLLLGVLFGPLGVIVEGQLPEGVAPPPTGPAGPSPPPPTAGPVIPPVRRPP